MIEEKSGIEEKNGGAAFPSTGHIAWRQALEPGMSLRDYFAGQCIIGFEPMSEDDAKTLAQTAYWMADAMLAARKDQP